MEWLLAPIDAARPHDVGLLVAWHARAMVVAWAVLVPFAVLVARFYKVLPNQDWPRVLDSRTWWRTHLFGQMAAAGCSFVGLLLILTVRGPVVTLHGWLGYGVLAGMFAQVMLGIFRGSKGGPSDAAKGYSLHGDHYDMTPRRLYFEWCHKTLGYVTLMLAAVTIFVGLWQANAPRWMWLIIVVWWVMLVGWAIHLQRQGRAVATYHAIWGDDPTHPGNCAPDRPRRMASLRKRMDTRETHDIRRH